MKFLVIALALFVAVSAVTEEQKEKVRKYGLECVEESGADKEEVKKLKSGETTEVDHKVKCFVKCFFRKTGFFNEHDELQEQVTVDKLSLDATAETRESVQEAVNKCKGETDADPCVKAFKIFKCYQDLKHVSLV
ncbi:general odorant-binding protein 56d-like [Ctenocephalides felis]|uniref:general odorant-binding protein 56d-like n=1 Tax=Ctenocephalides felis TaxID=7515 RepID=UPI000E6E4E71|nr:general odorant-binding protein 56d-like [Ctenocephalides felis]